MLLSRNKQRKKAESLRKNELAKVREKAGCLTYGAGPFYRS